MADQQDANRGCLPVSILLAFAIMGGLKVTKRRRKLPLADGRVELLGVPVDPLTMEETLRRVEEFIRSRQPHHIFTADAQGIMRATREPELMTDILHADLVTADGAGVLLGAEIQGVRLPERVSGVDLVERISALAAEKDYRVYLLGTTEEIIATAAEKLRARYPGLTIVGARHGFFSAEEEPALVREIAAARADVLFVALGIPKQERFIRRNFEELGVPVMIGVGGSFDVIAGLLRRAPRWMQRTGLEWFYRLLQQPSRLPRMLVYPRFVVAVWRRRKCA